MLQLEPVVHSPFIASYENRISATLYKLQSWTPLPILGSSDTSHSAEIVAPLNSKIPFLSNNARPDKVRILDGMAEEIAHALAIVCSSAGLC
jgi:hypothetical protein